MLLEDIKIEAIKYIGLVNELEEVNELTPNEASFLGVACGLCRELQYAIKVGNEANALDILLSLKQL